MKTCPHSQQHFLPPPPPTNNITIRLRLSHPPPFSEPSQYIILFATSKMGFRFLQTVVGHNQLKVYILAIWQRASGRFLLRIVFSQTETARHVGEGGGSAAADTTVFRLQYTQIGENTILAESGDNEGTRSWIKEKKRTYCIV